MCVSNALKNNIKASFIDKILINILNLIFILILDVPTLPNLILKMEKYNYYTQIFSAHDGGFEKWIQLILKHVTQKFYMLT